MQPCSAQQWGEQATCGWGCWRPGSHPSEMEAAEPSSTLTFLPSTVAKAGACSAAFLRASTQQLPAGSTRDKCLLDGSGSQAAGLVLCRIRNGSKHNHLFSVLPIKHSQYSRKTKQECCNSGALAGSALKRTLFSCFCNHKWKGKNTDPIKSPFPQKLSVV